MNRVLKKSNFLSAKRMNRVLKKSNFLSAVSAKIDLPVVCLMTFLHSEIREISKTDSFDLFKSLQPEIVIADMINIKNA